MHEPPPVQTAASTPSFEDFTAFPHPYLKASVGRLRSELFSAARALRGELLDAFWESIDELNDLRHAKTSASWRRSSVPQRLVVLDGAHQKAVLMRLRIDMFSVAQSMYGELLDEFWRSIDELNKLRPMK
jgi:hypothetical protein